MRPALRAALVAIPVYVAACAVPDGGLFRAARFRDVHVYQGYAAVPRRVRRVPAGSVRRLHAADGVRRGALQRCLQVADGALRRDDSRAAGARARRAAGLDDADAGRWGVETGHPRLLLCGAGTRRGGGVSGIGGHNAAMALLRG